MNELKIPARWGDKPYHSLDYEMKKRFGQKVYRLSLNGGTTCPNRDGKVGYGGCIFCSEGGSGDFAGRPWQSIPEQITAQKELLSKKRPVKAYIAYFQAYTATYAPLLHLRETFTQAIMQPDVAVLSVATRPDCLPDDVLDLLEELNQIKPVWVELGLQTMHDDTARFIRRGYDLPVFEKAVRDLRRRGIEVIVHAILGLPGETGENCGRVLETMRYLNTRDIQGIKLQLLHVLKHTDLAEYYFPEAPAGLENVSAGSVSQKNGPSPPAHHSKNTHAAPQLLPSFQVMTMDEYINEVIRCLEILRPDIVIHRLTGDGPKSLLIAPAWSSQKRTVLNTLHKRMKEQDAWQGKYYSV